MTGTTSGPRVPGTTLLKIARLLFNEHLLSTVVQPTILDLQRIARLAVGSILVALLAVVGPMLGASVAVIMAVGTLFAILIHAWYDRHPSDVPIPTEAQRRSPQINFSSTEVAGNIGGLIFVVGSVFIVAIGLPSVIWFLFAATVAGCFLAWALVTWHTSHPKRGLPENRIVLR
jgi:hypothetical protein